LDLLKNEPLSPREWEKLQNRVESTLIFSEISASNKAANLAYYELLGDIELINRESEAHRAVSPEVLQNRAQYLFQPQRSNTLRYYAEAKAEAKTEK
jgi:predicted Zn-dependent peptidase